MEDIGSPHLDMSKGFPIALDVQLSIACWKSVLCIVRYNCWVLHLSIISDNHTDYYSVLVQQIAGLAIDI